MNEQLPYITFNISSNSRLEKHRLPLRSSEKKVLYKDMFTNK